MLREHVAKLREILKEKLPQSPTSWDWGNGSAFSVTIN